MAVYLYIHTTKHDSTPKKQQTSRMFWLVCLCLCMHVLRGGLSDAERGRLPGLPVSAPEY